MTRFAISFVVLFPVSVCRADTDFVHDVVPILTQHCAECHAGEESEGGFSFNTLRLLNESAAVEPGHPDLSRLIELITSADPDDQMPPSDRKRLSSEEIASLRKWVSEGVPWEPGFRFGDTGYEPPLLPRHVTLPPAEFDGQHPIDRILKRYAAEHDLPDMELVDDRVFVRRASMDLLGLPPTVEEQAEFLRAHSEDPAAELVDRLLARDHDFAEHWLTFWNDLLRNDYVGTGYIDGGRKEITGWLYASLLENKPYNQFVRELIAPAEESAGFIRGIKWRGDVNASQVREIQFAQNVGQVFLGINMKCASCHDSFIDRWTLDEAYSLAAVYSERDLEIHRCDKPTGRIAKAAWIFPDLGTVDPSVEQPERLRQLAELFTHPQNGRFSRTIVNRLWHRLMGHGIVHPVDAMHTRPWSDDLLDYLAGELVARNYDLKQILRLIATSQAYRSAVTPADDLAASDEFVFRGPAARHLTAEQLMDAIWQLTGAAPARVDALVDVEVYLGKSRLSDLDPGQFIWAADPVVQAADGGSIVFRKILDFESLPENAVGIIANFREYAFVVNGTTIHEDGNFLDVDAVEFRDDLVSGRNTIDIVVRDTGPGPLAAALCADLILFGAGGPEYLPSGPEWQTMATAEKDQAGAGWTAAVPAVKHDALRDQKHNDIVNRTTGTILGNARRVRASMMKSDLLMRSLGRPNREQVVTTRPESLSTLQAIDLANGEIMDETLAAGGRKLLSELQRDDDFVLTMFLRALCREPTEDERTLADELLGFQPNAESVQDLIWTLIMLPEFQFVR